MRLIGGSSGEWEQLNPDLARSHPKPTLSEYEAARRREIKDSHAGSQAPYDFDEYVATDASYDAWRRRQHERLRWLLLNGLLSGEALEAGTKMKKAREWRHE